MRYAVMIICLVVGVAAAVLLLTGGYDYGPIAPTQAPLTRLP